MMTSSAPDQIGVGVIGAGLMGAHHVHALAATVSGARAVAVADADAARAQQAAEAAPGCRIVPDPLELIAAADVDAVLVASPDHTHEEYVTAALDAGKPVLCEKPLALTAEAALGLVRHEKGRDLIRVGFMRRFDPSYRQMQATLRSGELGAALMAHCVHRNAASPSTFSGDDSIVSSAVHEFDTLRWLLGQEITAVTVHTPTHAATAPGELRDPRLIVVEFSGGAVADIEVFVNARYGYDVRCELVGETGTVSLLPPATVRTCSGHREGTEVPDDFRTRFATAYRQELQAWIDGLRSGVDELATARDGYLAAVACEAAIESGRTGAAVSVGAEDLSGMP